jgi:DNA gyrase subunit A
MVQRTSVGGISQMGRSTQGVKVMNIKDDDRVSAVALVVESDDAAPAATEDDSQPELAETATDGSTPDGDSAGDADE